MAGFETGTLSVLLAITASVQSPGAPSWRPSDTRARTFNMISCAQHLLQTLQLYDNKFVCLFNEFSLGFLSLEMERILADRTITINTAGLFSEGELSLNP